MTPRDPRTTVGAEELRQRATLARQAAVTASRTRLTSRREARTRKEAMDGRRLEGTAVELRAEREAEEAALSAAEAWCDRPIADEFILYKRHEFLAARDSPLAHVVGAPGAADLDAPVVLLPVRIETRFVTDSTDPDIPQRKVLRCRIYPDEIAADTFEPRLRVWTDDSGAGRSELADGVAYWGRAKATESVLWAGLDSADTFRREPVDGRFASTVVQEWWAVRKEDAAVLGAWNSFVDVISTWHRSGAATPAAAQRGVRQAAARDWPLSRTTDDGVAATPTEHSVGQRFWEVLDADEEVAWRALLGRGYPARRCAWIVQATRPESRPEIRKLDWLRPAAATCLPDRWIVLGYQRQPMGDPSAALVEVFRVPTRAIRQPLAVSFSPADSLPEEDGESLPADEDSAWTIDFQRAVTAGMAVEITQDSGHTSFRFSDGLALVTVVGVRASIGATLGATLLGELLAHNRYSRGVDLVLPETPTNNTANTTAGYHSSKDRSGESLSFLRERRGLRPEEGSDGQRLLAALGIDASGQAVLSDLTIQRGVSDYWAGVNTRLVLGPTTIGYYLRHLLRLEDSRDATVLRAMTWLATYVRPGGPFASFRIGRNPYGVLPAMRVPRAPASDFAAPVSLDEVLGLLWPHWLRAAATVPHVGRETAELDPEGELLAILGMDGVSTALHLRPSAWPEATSGPLKQLPSNLSALATATPAWTPETAREAWNSLGLGELFLALAGEPDAFRLSGSALDLLTRLFPDQRNEATPATADLDLAREWAATGTRFGFLGHPVIWQVCSDERPMQLSEAAWGRTFLSFRNLLLGRSLALLEESRTGILTDDALRNAAHTVVERGYDPNTNDARDEAGVSRLDAQTFRRHCLQTIDSCSHRLDAWITSLATKRLSERTEGGCFLGGYGWVENLTPDAGGDRTSFGYIHAPSVDHAAAAAILRSAHVSEDSELASAFAVDLSSERVRRARWLLDGVRQGQAIGELLGYEFERAAHDAKLDAWIEDIRRKYPLKGIVLAADAELDRDPDTERPPQVVDGLALLDGWRSLDEAERSVGQLPWARNDAERAEESELGIDWGGLNLVEGDRTESPKATMARILRNLDDALDAVNDVLTAESVFQMVRGNRAGASAAMDVQSGGGLAPDPEVLATPVGGRLVHLRVAQALSATHPVSSVWSSSARAAVEPVLNAWLEGLVGSPGQYHARLVPVPSGRVGVGELPPDATWRDLSELVSESDGSPARGIAAIDLVDLSRRVAEVEARFIALAWRDPAWQGWDVRVEIEPTEDWPLELHSVAEALELGASAAALLGRARAIGPADLVAPGAPVRMSFDDAAAFGDRARDALTAAQSLLLTGRDLLGDRVDHQGDPPVSMTDRLADESDVTWVGRVPGSVGSWIQSVNRWVNGGLNQLSAVAVTRAVAEYGIGLARPCALRPTWEDVTLAGRLAEVRRLGAESGRFADELDGALDELERRIASSAEHIEVMDTAWTAGDATKVIEAATATIRALFGEAFLVLPTFGAPDSFASADSFVTGSTPIATATDIDDWTIEAARARPAVAAWQRLRVYSASLEPIDMFGTSAAGRDTWDRGPVPPGALPNQPAPPAAYVAWGGEAPAFGGKLVGLLIDAWTETIPHDHVTTGLAFHYDDAGAEAPQALLIAVPPNGMTCWTFDDLAATVRDTFELARVRGVTLERLGALAQLLPLVQWGSEGDPAGTPDAGWLDGLYEGPGAGGTT